MVAGTLDTIGNDPACARARRLRPAAGRLLPEVTTTEVHAALAETDAACLL
ncbi:hypothetical protein SSCG_05251 [Streptomyces clavuligerus]|nr:hypothetical protein SSCG_05251 [Streptomyces clavuligerus]